jgi:hypothetical protein
MSRFRGRLQEEWFLDYKEFVLVIFEVDLSAPFAASAADYRSSVCRVISKKEMGSWRGEGTHKESTLSATSTATAIIKNRTTTPTTIKSLYSLAKYRPLRVVVTFTSPQRWIIRGFSWRTTLSLLGVISVGDCNDSQYCLASSFRRSPNALVGFAARAASGSSEGVGDGLESERM